jgi:phosphomannomutase
MNYNPEIFREYDIRGVYGRDFDSQFAFKFGRAVAEFNKAKKILLGRDSRTFSEELLQAVAAGAASAGSKIESIGLATTPYFNFAFAKIKPDCGIMITASHNTPEYGGFKIFRNDDNAVGLDSGLLEIKKIMDQGTIVSGPVAEIINHGQDCLENYLSHILKKSRIKKDDIGKSGLKINIAGSSASLAETNFLFTKLGINTVSNGYDLFFTFDEDSDRINLKNSRNEAIGADLVVGLLAKDAVRFLKKPRVVCDLRFSRGVINKLKEWGIKYYQSRVGRTHLREMMLKNHCDVGGELSGHIYFKDSNYNELPLLAMLKLLKIITSSKMSIDELIKPFQTWYGSGEINFPIAGKSFRQITDELKARFVDSEMTEIDGLTVEYSDWWFNIRESHTEPLVRLIVEAKEKDLLEKKVEELKTFVS